MPVEIPRAAQRKKLRARAANFAAKGESPSDRFTGADLKWAFYTEELQADLARLDEVAQEAREAEARRLDEKQQRRRHSMATEVVLKEWRQQEEHELRERAEAEATKRIAAEDAA